jgi:hypothetical protein
MQDRKKLIQTLLHVIQDRQKLIQTLLHVIQDRQTLIRTLLHVIPCMTCNSVCISLCSVKALWFFLLLPNIFRLFGFNHICSFSEEGI